MLSEFRGLLLLIMKFAAIMLSTKIIPSIVSHTLLYTAFTRSCMQACCNKQQQQQRKHDYDKVMTKSQKCSQLPSSYGIA